MKFKKINDNLYVIKLDVGDEIIEELSSFCKDLDICAGQIEGIGAANEIELKHYNVSKKEYSSKTFNEEMEICSLWGLITKAGIHAHCTIANNRMQSFGGHLQSAKISAACEIILKVIPQICLEREADDYTGLNLLKL